MADVIVVGGGSAGCVLAARLSEDASRRVLLLEAGPDFTGPSDLPPELADASAPTETYDWGYVAEPDAVGRHRALPRARVIGGCSATNGCFALRGSPADYDGWAALGNPGWSFAEVLPFFQRLETDADFQNAWHGSSGPIPIRRHPPSELNRVQAAFVQAAVASGLPLVADHNEPGMLGVGPMPRNARDGVRMSTAVTYLAAARRRTNLVVRGNTLVDRVEVRQGVAAGVRLAGGELLEADQVILAAGAYASPALLMRSGIGPADQLLDLGIEVIVDLPGVGENLIDHPLVAVDLPVMPGWTGPRFQTMATWRSQRAPAAAAPDLHLFVAGPFDVPRDVSPTGAIFGLVTGLVLPFSRGRVRLRSADPGDPPRINPAHLRDPRDMPRMVEATLLARAISRTQPLAGLIDGLEINPGAPISDTDVQGIQASIATRVSSYHHPVGTCRMGPSPEEGAVVDAKGAVYGVEHLSVADASIMPTIPAANTNLPSIMIAERVASWMATGGLAATASASASDRTLPGI